MNRAIRMHADDSVAVLLCDAKKGDVLHVFDINNAFLFDIAVNENILYGNKVALHDIPEHSEIVKYGQSIGISTREIAKGCLVHVQNVKSLSVDIPDSIRREIIRQMHITD